MRYDLCNFAYLWKRGKMGCFERLISAVCWWLTAHFCNNKSKNAFCFWAGVVLHRPSTLAISMKEFRWLSHSFFHRWLLVFGFDRRTKEHIWVWPILLWNLCTCVWSLFYFGFWSSICHAELVSASHCEPIFTPFTRWDPELNSGWHDA